MTNLQNATVLVYGDVRLDIPQGTQLDALKASIQEVFPETAGATFEVVGTEVHVKIKAGTKGADDIVVNYGDVSLNVPAGTSIDAIKASINEVFPETVSASFTQEGNVVTVAVRASTKGAGDMITVIYADTQLQVPQETSIEAIKESFKEIFPETASADFIRVGDVIEVVAKAGTKGNEFSEITVRENSTTTVVADYEAGSESKVDHSVDGITITVK